MEGDNRGNELLFVFSEQRIVHLQFVLGERKRWKRSRIRDVCRLLRVPLDSITEDNSILNDDEQEKSVLSLLGV